MRRLDDLSRAYGNGPLALDFRGLLAIAEQVTTTVDQTRWVDVVSVSARQQRRPRWAGWSAAPPSAGPCAPARSHRLGQPDPRRAQRGQRRRLVHPDWDGGLAVTLAAKHCFANLTATGISEYQ
ncbi:hypothetical protein [Chloroflexus sp.]|uniref:hypothetical protein n=1 Tax=Chloroflexus sp. TaxID=1904827 RepID=UPI002ACEE726|nr:hypothetical protein [Chloroflexus sp.]